MLCKVNFLLRPGRVVFFVSLPGARLVRNQSTFDRCDGSHAFVLFPRTCAMLPGCVLTTNHLRIEHYSYEACLVAQITRASFCKEKHCDSWHPSTARPCPCPCLLLLSLRPLLAVRKSCRLPQRGPYPWAIVSDPLRAFLFVLVRDPEDFFGSKAEKKVLARCEKLGFTASWNSPRKTVQEGCSYTTDPAEADAAEAADAAAVEVEDGGALSSVFKLRGGAVGLGGPLHASCKASGRGIGAPDGLESQIYYCMEGQKYAFYVR